MGEDDDAAGDALGARLSLLYNGIHRLDASRVKTLVLPLAPPPGPGPAGCCVVFAESFEPNEEPPVAPAATARFSSDSREIFRKMLDSVEVLGIRSWLDLIVGSSFVLAWAADDAFIWLSRFKFNCRRDAGM